MKLLGVHSGVLLLMLGISTIGLFLLPPWIRAIDVFKWIPPVYVVYLGTYYLFTSMRTKSQARKKDK